MGSSAFLPAGPLAVLATAFAVAVSSFAFAQQSRYLILVQAPVVFVFAQPDTAARIVARLEQGTQVESDARQGAWYRFRRADGTPGWISNGAENVDGPLMVRAFPEGSRVEAEAARPEPGVGEQAQAIERARPQGVPLEPRLPVIDPAQVEPPAPYARRETIPVPDRWRIVQSLGLLPYKRLDPYNPNVLKGDLPVLEKELGTGWFFSLVAVSDTLVEARRLPTPVGAQSTLGAGANGTLGRGRQSTIAETAIVGLSLIKGNTTFRPPDYEFRVVPVVNINRTQTQEVRAVNINPAAGPDRNDSFVGMQELFADVHLRDVSPRYDFDSVRLGIQPFNADFRGFLFLDQPFGARLFGTRDNNRIQYNAAWLRRLEKDTNSGLNDIGQRARADDIFVVNAYRQDTFVDGFTLQGLALHNRNREGSRGEYYNGNGFLERPAIFGTGRPRNYDATYLGINGDGHFGRWNVSASAYYVFGRDRRGMISGANETIDARFGAIEVSRDFDWLRVRASGLWASGDKNPTDAKASGFDAVLENPQFAGADTSYWIRQGVPLIGGGGTALSMRNGILASLRTSREHGQSNFTNPGLRLLGIGADADLSPRVRLILNANYLQFDNASSLAVLRNQRLGSTKIGTDLSAGVQIRPYFNQNVVINASIAALFPGKGLRELYGSAVDSTQYSALFNLLLTF